MSDRNPLIRHKSMPINLVNMTPHQITIRISDGTDVVIAPSGSVARVSSVAGSVTKQSFEIGDFAVAESTVFGEVEGLPPPSPGIAYIVSALVGAALKGTRVDVLMPGTGPSDGAIRENGQIKAVTRLVRA